MMKQAYFILILLTFSTNFVHSQSQSPRAKLTGNILSDLKTLLPNGVQRADIMDGVLQSPRQIELSNKFRSAIKENYQWFLEYSKTIPAGKPMPYHPKLGLTKEEYAELIDFMNNIELVSTGKEDIIVEVKDDVIRFKSQNKLAYLESLAIDLKSNVVTFGKYEMKFSNKVDIKTDKNGLKSKWKGYHWEFKEPNNLDMNSLKDLNTLKAIQYSLTIGRLEKNGKTYIKFEGKEMANGAKTVDINLPLQF